MDGWYVFSRDATKLPTAPKESHSEAHDRSDMWMEWAIMPFVAWISVKLQIVLLCPPIATWLENCEWVDFEPIHHPSHLVWFLKPIHHDLQVDGRACHNTQVRRASVVSNTVQKEMMWANKWMLVGQITSCQMCKWFASKRYLRSFVWIVVEV